MKKAIIICSAIIATLLCVSGVTVFALSTDTAPVNPDVQDKENPEDVFPPVEETVPDVDEAEVVEEAVDTSEEPELGIAETEEEQVIPEEPIVEAETFATLEEKYRRPCTMVNLSQIALDEIPADAVVVNPDDQYSQGKESYPTMDELRQIRNMSYYGEVLERFGLPDEELYVYSGRADVSVIKYFANNGEYVTIDVATHIYGDNEWLIQSVHLISCSDEVTE